MNVYEMFLKEKGFVIVGSLKGKKFYVDPGHGGTDAGAVANGMIERDINLPMALNFGGLLKYLGAEIFYSRTDNELNKSLRARAEESIYYDVDFFFSQHNNAGGGKDFEIFHTTYTDNSQGDEMAKSIAKSVDKYSHQDIRRITDRTNSSGEDYYALHRYTKHITTLIMEGGFLDGDVEDIDTREKRKAIALAEALGVALHYDVVKEAPPKQQSDITKALDQVIEGLVIINNKLKGV